MIKYGVNGKELKNLDNKELVMTERGFVKRPKSEKRKSSIDNKTVRKIWTKEEILSHYSGYPVEDLRMSKYE